jgi:hypothetical protein
MDNKLKKILKRILLVTFGMLLFLFLCCYFILHYRTKYLISQIVRIETNDTYDIDFSDLSLSLLTGDVKIKNASFNSRKTGSNQSSYQVKVPEFYLSLKSWRPLLSQKRFIVDSLYIGRPEIKIFQSAETDTSNRPGFELRNIYEMIKQTANNLKVRTLQIQEASVEFYPQHIANYSLKVDHVNFRVVNFKKRKKESRHFFLSDDVDLSIWDQHWILPNGNSIDFSTLHFSGKDQLFEIDSCLLKTGASGNGNSAEIRASKFFFISSQLTSAYLKGKLLIDTLSCINPVIQLRSESNDHKDTTTLLAKSLTQFFDEIHFNYINVADGQLSLLKKDDNKFENYQSQKANLRLYDLDIHSRQSSSFSLRKIEFELDTVGFFSQDSAYVLKVAHFSINNGDLTCENALFIPYKEDGGDNMKLILPQIILRNISLEDLLQKRLKATSAEFNDPEIFISSGEFPKPENIRKAKAVDALYDALHSFGGLINVEVMYVNQGDVHYLANENEVSINATNMTAAIRLNDLFQSDSLVNIKTALRQVSFDAIKLASPQVRFELDNVRQKGATQESQITDAIVELKNGIILKANNVFLSQLDWDLLYNTKKVNIDKVSFGKLDVQYKQPALEAEEGHPPHFTANSVYIDNLTAAIALRNGSKITTKGSDLVVSNLTNNETGLEWRDIKSKFENSTFLKPGLKITAETSVIDKQKGSVLKNVKISVNKNEFLLPEVNLATTINNTRLSNLHCQYLVIDEPTVSVTAGENNVEGNIPFNLSADKLEINKAKISYRSKPEDSLQLTAFGDISVDSFQMSDRGSQLLSYQSLRMKLTNAEMVNRKVIASIPLASAGLLQSELQKTPEGKLSFKSDAKVQWMDASIKRRDSSKYVANLSNLSGEITYPALETSKKITPGDLMAKLKIRNGSLFYSNVARTIRADKLKLDAAQGNLEMESISIKPNLSRNMFFQALTRQKDYLEIDCGKLSLDNFDIRKYLKDTAVDIREIIIENASIATSRDKTIPFEHGIEKPMPTKLIQSIKRPFRIQHVIVKNADITSNEISVTTKREGSVPFVSVNGEIRNINNNPLPADSLSVYANAIFFDHHIRSLLYKESYADSLSGFHMVVKISPMDLTALTQVTNPLAAIDIDRGRSDTLVERIAGNKYAAFGEMKFTYHGLKVRVLDPIDTAKRNLVLSFKNFATNKFVVKTNNNKYSTIFFIRDSERFIFNYWVKTTFSGIITSTGLKNDKKYLKQYEKVKDDYSLPPREW